MIGRLVASLLLLALAGCATGGDPLPATCLDGGAAIAGALASAPAPVALRDGTRLSTCVQRARSEGELQALGSALTRLAEALRARARADRRAALRLGYLIGAARRGAQASGGVAAQLDRRLERTAALDRPSPGVRAALERGMSAGRSSG